MRRGQFDQALPLLQHAYEHEQHMGMRQLLSTALQGLLVSHKMLLQYADELTTSDEYWPFTQKGMEFCDDNVRRGLVILRATALADNGRTSEASSVLEQLIAQPKPEDDPTLTAWASAMLAKFALERGETQAAVAWITKAFAGSALEQDDDHRDYADASLVRINILLRAGRLDELKQAVATLQAWATHRTEQDDWIDIAVMRANAAQAWGEGQQGQALEQLKLAMTKADKLGVPELVVGVGQAYALALLRTGNVDQAVAISGRLSAWSNADWRAAWVEACTYRALGQTASWEKSRGKAQALAGDRMQLADASVFSF
jgi:Flp pilus assembly protein TadD